MRRGQLIPRDQARPRVRSHRQIARIEMRARVEVAPGGRGAGERVVGEGAEGDGAVAPVHPGGGGIVAVDGGGKGGGGEVGGVRGGELEEGGGELVVGW